LKKFNTDKFLIFLCLWVFVVVLISQIGLKIPYLKSVFTDIEVFEGKAINEDSAINSGVITLEMVSGLPSDEFEIMINGEKYDVFDEKVKKIEILSTSVVEVLSSSKDGAVIKISDMTSNLKAVTSGIDVSIKKGINMVSRIILKS